MGLNKNAEKLDKLHIVYLVQFSIFDHADYEDSGQVIYVSNSYSSRTQDFFVSTFI